MTKWIRGWGLGAFLVVAAILVCVWIFLVDGWVRYLIEEAGTEAVGAKVELDAADLSLFPAGLTLSRLQVTNPKAPMTNAVEMAKVTMGLDGLHLLRRKVIVEEMAVGRRSIRDSQGYIRSDPGSFPSRGRVWGVFYRSSFS